MYLTSPKRCEVSDTTCEYNGFRSADVRDMLELVNELREMPPQFLPRARRMVEGICQLIGAQVAIFSDLKRYLVGMQWDIKPLADTGWTDAAARRTFMSFFDGPQTNDPLTPFCTRPQGRVVTVLRRQMVDDQDWYRSANVNELRRGGRLDDCIYSHFRLSEHGRAMGMAFHRPWGDRPFGQRECAIVHLMHESQPIYSHNFVPDGQWRDLSPRQAEVLAALKLGQSEKQVAQELGMSRHTVHVHVKTLYRRFAVQSRGELLSLWLKRGA